MLEWRLLIRYGVTANITAFHAVARGSIPRIGTCFASFAEVGLVSFAPWYTDIRSLKPREDLLNEIIHLYTAFTNTTHIKAGKIYGSLTTRSYLQGASPSSSPGTGSGNLQKMDQGLFLYITRRYRTV